MERQSQLLTSLTVLGLALSSLGDTARGDTEIYARSSQWYVVAFDRTVKTSELRLSAEAIGTPLPYQAVRVHLKLQNVTERRLGPIPHPGVNAGLTSFRVPDGRLLRYRLHFPARALRYVYGYGIALMLDPGESVTVSLPIGGIFTRPGKHALEFEYTLRPTENLDQREVVRCQTVVSVGEPRGDEAKAIELIRKTQGMAASLLPTKQMPAESVLVALQELVKECPESTYANYARLALASLPRDRYAAVGQLLDIKDQDFAYTPGKLLELRSLYTQLRDPGADVAQGDLEENFGDAIEYLENWATKVFEDDERWEKFAKVTRRPVLKKGVRIFNPERTLDSRLGAITQIDITRTELVATDRGDVYVYQLDSVTQVPVRLLVGAHDFIAIAVQNGKHRIAGLRRGRPPTWLAKNNAKNSLLHDAPKASRMAFAASAPVLAIHDRQSCQIWNYQTQKKLGELRPTGQVNGPLAIDGDGRRIAFANISYAKSDIFLWVAESKSPTQIGTHHSSNTALAFSPDGQMLASSYSDATVLVFSLRNQRNTATLTAHHGGVHQVAFSPDSRYLATAGADQCCRIWETATGREVAVLLGHDREVLSVAFFPDGKQLAAGCADGKIKIWNLESLK